MKQIQLTLGLDLFVIVSAFGQTTNLGTNSGENATGDFTGFGSGQNNTGSTNVFLGRLAWSQNQTGENSTYLDFVPETNSSGSNNVFIGNKSGSTQLGSNKLYIENSDVSAPLICGDFDAELVNINGKLGIGAKTPDEKRTVKGKTHTQEVRLDVTGAVAPDYVFEKYYLGESLLEPDYNMPTLKEVEAYTKAKNHLPEIPSSKEMQENGISSKEINLKVSQKIEELTLYAIEQQEELESQKKKNNSLESRVEKIEAFLTSKN